jgi:acetate kinase
MLHSQPQSAILCINLGSSSIKFSLFRAEGSQPTEEDELFTENVPARGFHLDGALETIARRLEDVRLVAVGHRVVFGGEEHVAPEPVTDALLDDLERFVPFVPLHLPREIAAIRRSALHFRNVPQIACFDTAFHADMPAIAKHIPVPRRFWQKGVRRYGFHGLSYEYVVGKLGDEAQGRVIVAHLGSGASLAAIRDGRPMDTTMGLSALGGLMMGTRPGDLDPGVLLYLLRSGVEPDALEALLQEESGLLGASETTPDVAALLAKRKIDRRAADALDMFVYSVRKHIGALTAVLGGLDLLVFTGGIGENAPEIRDAISADLAPPAPVVRIIPTNENLVLARYAYALTFNGLVRNIRAEPIR